VAPEQTLRVSCLLGLLGRDELTKDVIAALAILVQSEYAIFRASAEFVDDDGTRHPLSPEEFQRALNVDTVLHPLTNEDVAGASERVVPFFELDSDLFEVPVS